MKRISKYILLLLLIFVVSCQADSCNDSSEQVPSPMPATESLSHSDKSTTVAGPFFLTIETPSSLDLVVNDSSLLIEGETRVDALLTIGDDVVEPGIDGKFNHELELITGHNHIEIIASISSGAQEFVILSVIYED